MSAPSHPTARALAAHRERLRLETGQPHRADFADVMRRVVAHEHGGSWVDPKVVRLRAEPTTATPRDRAVTAPGRWSRLGWACVGAAAAAVVLLSIGTMLPGARGSQRLEVHVHAVLVDQVSSANIQEQARLRALNRAAQGPRPGPKAAERAPEPTQATTLVPPVPEPIPVPKRAPQPGPRTPHRVDWGTLNGEALAAWRGGDLEQALRGFARIANKGPTRYAELAYGELSLLTRKLRGKQAQYKLWRAYLRRFPKGRYADDWSAALCRVQTDPSACWANYLKQRPQGAHAAAARQSSSQAPRGGAQR